MHADVVVVGGGVIGNAAAFYCARAGMSVIVVERQDILNGTSSACDTAIHLQSKSPGVHLAMALNSIKKYPGLQKEFDIDIHFNITGTMLAIQKEEQLEVMKSFAARQQEAGLNVSLLDRAQTIAKQPAMRGAELVGSTYCDQDATIHPQNLTKAYCFGAMKYGAKYLLHTAIRSFRIEDNCLTGVDTDQGMISCRWVVNAGGVFAPFIGKMMGLDIPIVPRRGQILVTEPVPKLTNTIVNCAKYIAAKFRPDLLGNSVEDQLGIGLSLTQTERGNLLLGGTREFVGYDTGTTRQAMILIAKHGTAIIPALKQINIIRSFAGLRPYTPDSLPIISTVPELKGLVIAAGHEGDGLALSAVTGEMVSEMIAGKPLSSGIDLSRLSLARFSQEDIDGFYRKYRKYAVA